MLMEQRFDRLGVLLAEEEAAAAERAPRPARAPNAAAKSKKQRRPRAKE